MEIEVNASKALNPAGGFLESFTHTFNPYSGCGFGRLGCPFCYVRQHLPQRFGPRDDAGNSIPWGHWLKVRSNVDQRLERELGREGAEDYRIYMGSVTDPYQPAEARHRLTRRCLEVFQSHPVAHLTLQTRSILFESDLDRLRELPFLALNLTIETDSDAMHQLFTRSSASPTRRLKAARRASEAGIATVITVSPLLPLDDPDQFAAQIAEAADFAVVDTLALGDGAGGRRSRRNQMPEKLKAAGFPGFMDETGQRDRLFGALERRLGTERVGLSQAGFAAAASWATARG